MRYKVWRSNKDKELHLLCAEGAEAFNALPMSCEHHCRAAIDDQIEGGARVSRPDDLVSFSDLLLGALRLIRLCRKPAPINLVT